MGGGLLYHLSSISSTVDGTGQEGGGAVGIGAPPCGLGGQAEEQQVATRDPCVSKGWRLDCGDGVC